MPYLCALIPCVSTQNNYVLKIIQFFFLPNYLKIKYLQIIFKKLENFNISLTYLQLFCYIFATVILLKTTTK